MTRRGRTWGALAALVGSAALLSACGTTGAARAPRVTGLPSISISVPLGLVACQPTGTCVAVGQSTTGIGPSATAEVHSASGTWRAMRVPGLVGSAITGGSCWDQGCLFVGSQPSGDLVWRYHPASVAMTRAHAPADAVGLSQVDCLAGGTCWALDATASGGAARLLATSDGATTWTSPLTLTWTTGLSVRALACTSAQACLVAATDGHVVTLERTGDAGASWTALAHPQAWSDLSSLQCFARGCWALARVGARTELVHQVHGRWRSVPVTGSPGALACTTQERCVVVGTHSGAPWVATVTSGVATSARLRYVPSAPVAVACGERRCAAVASATVLSLTP